MGRKERRSDRNKAHLNKTRKQVKADNKVLWIMGTIVAIMFIATIILRQQ